MATVNVHTKKLHTSLTQSVEGVINHDTNLVWLQHQIQLLWILPGLLNYKFWSVHKKLNMIILNAKRRKNWSWCSSIFHRNETLTWPTLFFQSSQPSMSAILLELQSLTYGGSFHLGCMWDSWAVLSVLIYPLWSSLSSFSYVLLLWDTAMPTMRLEVIFSLGSNSHNSHVKTRELN